jgi:hypothetical protein
MYHQEEESVKARLEELKAANEDYYVVKKQVRYEQFSLNTMYENS